jgi:DNA-binding NarL/FixJ family response regulator
VECVSPRELQVAALVGRGLSNKEIARELGISEGTVKLHVHNLLIKLGVKNRSGIVLACGQRPLTSVIRRPKD